MEITGRVTGDAVATITKSEKQVINFTIAVNDSYKPKDGERREFTTYVKCAVWRNGNLAEHLKKGALVQAYGRLGMDVYNNMDGKAMGSITLIVNDLKILAFPRPKEANETANIITGNTGGNVAVQDKDDLPF